MDGGVEGDAERTERVSLQGRKHHQPCASGSRTLVMHKPEGLDWTAASDQQSTLNSLPLQESRSISSFNCHIHHPLFHDPLSNLTSEYI